jgi:formiminotetrahydrofolate cyclodeaminase
VISFNYLLDTLHRSSMGIPEASISGIIGSVLTMMWNRLAVSELTFFGGATPGQFERLHMRLQDSTLEEVLADIGRTSPRISGSTAALAAAQLGTAMAKMGLLVSCSHGFDNEFAVERLDSMIANIKQATERDRAASTALIDAYRRLADEQELEKACVGATREPLAAAYLLIQVLGFLRENSEHVDPSVASDFHGGTELIGAAFTTVMMAIETNLQGDQ